MAVSRRSGSYKRTGSGYMAFFPAPIPPLSELDMSEKLLSLLSKADLSIGRLDGIFRTIPDPDLFVMMYIKKEAVLSSQIEGTQASLMDVLEYEGRSLDPADRGDLPDVLNYIAALRMGQERIGKGGKMDMEMVRRLHAILMKKTRGDEHAGEFRTIQNWIGSRDGSIEDAFFIPPPPEQVMSAMKGLERYIVKVHDVPPLIKASLAHAWFESIHPFLDGNGRVGRLMITMMLLKEGHIARPMLYLSHYFKKNRTDYYDALQSFRDQDRIEGWIAFFLRGIIAVSEEAYDKTLSILQMKERLTQRIMAEMGRSSPAGIKVLEDMFHRPVVNVNSVMEFTALSFPSANKLVSDLSGMGVIIEVTGHKKNRVFKFKEYLDLLEK